MSLLVDLIGTNGSGKSTLPRYLAANDPKQYVLLGESDKPIGTIFPTFRWSAVGTYKTKCGGADTLVKAEIMEAIVKLCRTSYNVLVEGIMVSDVKDTYWDVLANIHNVFPGRQARVIVMDYPLETCIQRVYGRNGNKPINEALVAKKHAHVVRNARVYEQRIADGANVKLYRENHEGVDRMLLSLTEILGIPYDYNIRTVVDELR